MTQRTERCPAKMRSGKRCTKQGKSEYRGYCGTHKSVPLEKKIATANERDQRLATLLTVGVALIEITSKAIEYLPHAIEVLIKAAGLAFIDEDDSRLRERMHAENITFRYAPRALPGQIELELKNGNWQSLANMLAYSFDVEVDSGQIPKSLRSEIDRRKQELQAALRAAGYRPGPHTVHRPLFMRTIENE